MRFALAKNINRLSEFQGVYVEARNTLVRQFANGGDTVPPEEASAFSSAVAELREQDEAVTPDKIAYSDLQPDTNPIAPSVIAALMPIIASQEQG
jgi:hypothetical protein